MGELGCGDGLIGRRWCQPTVRIVHVTPIGGEIAKVHTTIHNPKVSKIDLNGLKVSNFTYYLKVAKHNIPETVLSIQR